MSYVIAGYLCSAVVLASYAINLILRHRRGGSR